MASCKLFDKILYINDGNIKTYMGNYSYFLEEKKQEVKIETIKPQRVERKEKALKMTYKEQKEFETIMDDITIIEEKISELDKLISENYANYEAMKKYQDEKDIYEEELLSKMERWEYLSDLSERCKK